MKKISRLIREQLLEFLYISTPSQIEQFIGIMSLSEVGRETYLESIEEDLENYTEDESNVFYFLFGECGKERLLDYYKKALFIIDLFDSVNPQLIEQIIGEFLEDEGGEDIA